MRLRSPRMRKVNSTLREVIAEEIERLSDSRLEMVAVTAVDTAPSLRHAIVYIDVLGYDRYPEALDALQRAAWRIQSAIGLQVRMKYTPTLEFQIDQGVVTGERMDELIGLLQIDEEEE